jgi:DNA adenine methylase
VASLKKINEFSVYPPAVPSTPPPGEEEPTASSRVGGTRLIPFLKWPGGKRWLVSTHPDVLPRSYNVYIEPFLGAGSVYFHLQPDRAVLGDLNGDVITVYHGIRQDAESVQALLEKHHALHCKEHYYEVREIVPVSLAAQAARIIYLNRTCFNGIYRVNRNGQFNVPIGERRQVVRDTDDFAAVAALLGGADLRNEDFEPLVDQAKSGDFVFLDPPYTVRHNRNGFIKYNEHLFSWADQERLARAAARACRRGAKVVITNASHVTIRQLYPEDLFTFQEVSRYSSISASLDSRKHFDELVISSR